MDKHTAMIPKIQELNFPEYATLTSADVEFNDMGEKNITAQVKISKAIVPDFDNWAVVFQDEKYIMPLRKPQGSVENEHNYAPYDLTFQHWAVYELKRYFFCTMQPLDSSTAIVDGYNASVQLNLGDMCQLLAQVLRHYYGESIKVDLNPEWSYNPEPVLMEIDHTYIWDVLGKFYETYGVHWSIETASDNSHENGKERYVIRIGYPTDEIDHIFEYGFNGGLLKLERQVQSDEIRNMLIGRGGTKNIPKYYFKKSPDEAQWRSDPDACEELANIYFANLRCATFRSYIQGWNAKHHEGTVTKDEAFCAWAWEKGYTDEKFDPVEYVKDDESIALYGILMGGLDDNEDIYPSIQNRIVEPYGRIDEVVDVEQVTTDDVEESAAAESVISNLEEILYTKTYVEPATYYDATIRSGQYFTVPEGKTANLTVNITVLRVIDAGSGNAIDDVATANIYGESTIRVFDASTGEERSATAIPSGTWRYQVEVHNIMNETTDKVLHITIGDGSPKLEIGDATKNKWLGTFDVWVKNIWNTTKGADESDAQYSERVWRQILGDREGQSAAIAFTTGALAVSEDYSFIIAEYPTYDISKELDGVRSHWRIKCTKSDADYESTGLYVPSTMRQGKGGDKFVFTGIELPHDYVLWAERDLHDNKTDALAKVSDIQPTFVVTTDRVAINKSGAADALINKIKLGCSLRLADERLIGKEVRTQYIQSLKYTFREPSSDDTALNPDLEITLSEELGTKASVVSTLQSDISALQYQLGSLSNIEQLVRIIGDALYLRKDGISDRSYSPTQFASLLTSVDFRKGIVGGNGWGVYRDDNGNVVIETDKLNVRQEMQVNNLVINQITARGGMEIASAAALEITAVEEEGNDYICYFDQKDGSVLNTFAVGDIAYCNRFTAENTTLKFYKRRVTAIGENYVALTKGYESGNEPSGWDDGGVNGSGIPSKGDVIVQYGSYTNTARQYVIVKDVIGGGYERYIEGLSSVKTNGIEYVFVGKQDGEKPRWFVGHKDKTPNSGKGDGEYIEYQDGKLNLNNVRLSIGTKIEDTPITDYLNQNASPYVLDLTNEMAGVQCDAQGNTIGALPTSRAVVRKGTDVVTEGITYSIADKSGYVGATISASGLLTITSLGSNTANVIVQAVVGGVTLQATFSIYKVIPGDSGKDAALITISGEQVFTYANNFATLVSPQTITLTANLQNTTGYQWSYKAEGQSEFTALGTAQTQVIDPTTHFPNGAKSIIVRCASGGVYDQISIVKVSSGTNGENGEDGKDGEDAITIILTNESHVFAADTQAAITASTQTQIIAYKGATQVTATISKISALPTGMSVSLSNNGTTSTTATIAVTPALIIKAGIVTFTMLVQGKQYTKDFSWSLSLQGDKGEQGDAAIVYSIQPTATAITRDFLGRLSKSSVSCLVRKTIGTSALQLTDEKTLTYTREPDGASGALEHPSGLSSAVDVLDDTTSITFELSDGDVVLDRETVPVVNDASGLEVSGVNILRQTNQGSTNWSENRYPSGEAPTALKVGAMSDYPFGAIFSNPNIPTYEGNIYYYLRYRCNPSGGAFDVAMEVNKPYMLSCDIELTGTGNFLVLPRLSNYSPSKDVALSTTAQYINNLAGSTKVHCQWLVYIEEEMPQMAYLYLQLVALNASQSNWLSAKIYNLKLEKGTVATPWSPAPNDTNYLLKAFEQSTTIAGGLILSSLIQLGYTDKFGARKVGAGMNGILENDSDIVLWSGGEQKDASQSSDEDVATFLVRRDGTFYGAKNILRFLADAMEVGDYVRLDKGGLHLIDTASGEERLIVSNASVGSLLNLVQTSRVAVNTDGLLPVLTFKRITDSTTATTIKPQNGYYLASAKKINNITLYNGEAVTIDGTTLNATIKLNFTLGLDKEGITANFAMILERSVNGTAWSEETRFGSSLASVAASHTITFKTNNYPLKKPYKYRLRFEIVGAYSGEGSDVSVKANSFTGDGAVITGAQNKTILGTNGLGAAWGNSALCVNSASVGMISGTYGVQCIKDVGIQITTDGATWKTINISKLSELGII